MKAYNCEKLMLPLKIGCLIALGKALRYMYMYNTNCREAIVITRDLFKGVGTKAPFNGGFAFG